MKIRLTIVFAILLTTFSGLAYAADTAELEAKIHELQAKVEELEAALRSIRDSNFINLTNPGESQAPIMRRIARAALKEELKKEVEVDNVYIGNPFVNND